MAMRSKEEETSHDQSADQRTSNELARLICKLRWIGMEQEAEPLMQELARGGTETPVMSSCCLVRPTDAHFPIGTRVPSEGLGCRPATKKGESERRVH